MPIGTISDVEHVLSARWVSVPSADGRPRLEMVWQPVAAPAQVPSTDAAAADVDDAFPRQRDAWSPVSG